MSDDDKSAVHARIRIDYAQLATVADQTDGYYAEKKTKDLTISPADKAMLADSSFYTKATVKKGNYVATLSISKGEDSASAPKIDESVLLKVMSNISSRL